MGPQAGVKRSETPERAAKKQNPEGVNGERMLTLMSYINSTTTACLVFFLMRYTMPSISMREGGTSPSSSR